MGVYPEGYGVKYGAQISDCGTYRYRLTRQWSAALQPLPFIMLNPSTADGTIDDPTIRRCVGFAHALGFGGIGVWNLYAYRATKPTEVWKAAKEGVDIVGPDNDRRLRNLFLWTSTMGIPVVAAWGAHAKPDRVAEVLAMPCASSRLHHLGLTAKGVPRHPLMLPSAAVLTPWAEAAA